MAKKLLSTVAALTLAGSFSVMAATTEVALYNPKQKVTEPSYFNVSLAHISSLMKWPYSLVMGKNTVPERHAEISNGSSAGVTTELQVYGTETQTSEEPATTALALNSSQARPTPAAHTGYEVIALNPDASVVVVPGTSGIIPMVVKRATSLIGLGSDVQEESGKTVNLDMADLYHESSPGSASESQAVYLACYSQPGYEKNKGYLVSGNYRVLGFIRVNGSYEGIKAIPEYIERNDNPDNGWDISQATHMYSRHCNNFLEACMNIDEQGELVSNCWAGGETGAMKSRLDAVHDERYRATWHESVNGVSNSTAIAY
ncbi:hypothetical protein M3P05_11235 [Sansalvadorimonas sp. 2012CJ34-2]|uniref:Uncharacterized protein n=1 Tax=Parendozoicomonas callyspongiae TaxID=2942213 RepID=A0ABT0PGL8_9GAMM|nr:hypothetical protein [Sansalvadorimonas sp. 2012CJ34-2]MCL6270495.1 hypothetical protein [Sansalvadorimonas sp. 2012CJ34-2]